MRRLACLRRKGVAIVKEFLSIFTVGFFTSGIRMATPLILGGIGAMFSERAGILNLGVEGMMLMGAFMAAIVSLYTGSAWLGVLGGALLGGLVGLLHAVMCIRVKANQTVIGTGINIMAMGVPPLILQKLFGNPGSSPSVPPLRPIDLPLIKDIPIIGPVIGRHNPLTYFALILVPLTAFFMYRMKLGLRIRAVGEHPLAADTLGVNVFRIKYGCVIFSGVLSGIAGAYLSLSQVSMFVKGMTNGRGFMALAAMIFGNWTPFGVMKGAFLFGFADSLQFSIQVGGSAIPADLLLGLPYVLTIVTLAGFVGKAVGPKSVGQPYIKN